MNRGESTWIWQADDWPRWRYDLPALAGKLVEVGRAEGILIGRLTGAGLPLQDQIVLSATTEDVVRTSAIEGEILDPFSVRSSIARHLGMDVGAVAPVDRRVEGIVSMVLDATTRCRDPLTAERLWQWHTALFPPERSTSDGIAVGRWRDDTLGPMQVISNPFGRRRVHFQAPPADRLPTDMARFLDWANRDTNEPGVLKAALAHLWFVTLHPFDDGNGRMARAIGDLFLARADGRPQRCYSMSAGIQRRRRDYYHILEQTQRGTLDVTSWLSWFLDTLSDAMIGAQSVVDSALHKASWWQRWGGTSLNVRQVLLLNRLLDGFEGKLTSSKWAIIAKCSPDTALRDITQLIDLGMLRRSQSGGRSTSYELVG